MIIIIFVELLTHWMWGNANRFYARLLLADTCFDLNFVMPHMIAKKLIRVAMWTIILKEKWTKIKHTSSVENIVYEWLEASNNNFSSLGEKRLWKGMRKWAIKVNMCRIVWNEKKTFYQSRFAIWILKIFSIIRFVITFKTTFYTLSCVCTALKNIFMITARGLTIRINVFLFFSTLSSTFYSRSTRNCYVALALCSFARKKNIILLAIYHPFLMNAS